MIVVDRIEENFIIIEENGLFFNILVADIKGIVKEGDILIRKKNGFEKDKNSTKQRKEYMKNKLENIFQSHNN